MIHRLPTIRSDLNGFTGLGGLAEWAKDLADDCLEVDFSQCGFFDANLAACLASVLARVAEKSNTIKITSVGQEAEKILRKNNFLSSYGYSSLADNNHTTLPFARIQIADQNCFAEYLDQHMNGKGIPRMSEALSKLFRQSIFEVFQNCIIHSSSQSGIFVCGQFYPRLKRLDLTISDAGVGIRTNVRRHLRNNQIKSVDAIRWALKEGNSTKINNQPGGMGLKLLKEFIELNKGKIQIVSRQGFYQFERSQETFRALSSDLPGTTVNLEINTGDRHTYRLKSEVTPDDIF
ncbi:ATP-binding protein [Candidatus Methylospira mobilis]|uniref:ATP-binding protein n=2 Tax=Candidatus Methylospira mobilis TaxID=1808979 RepID=A0A5Q0BSR9_9GAMM|nr:ATP-binding protein [Candidatus Methylospira mobilis]